MLLWLCSEDSSTVTAKSLIIKPHVTADLYSRGDIMKTRWKIFLILIIIILLFHGAWYATSRIITGRDIPDEKTISNFQKATAKYHKFDSSKILILEDYITAYGNKIHLDVFPGKKDSMTIVFIPGTSVYAQVFIEFMYKMNQQGFNVIGFDPRGHGRSGGRRGDYTINEIVDDTLAVVRYARKRFNGRVAVVGCSQGGIAAFYTAARDNSIAAVVCHGVADLDGNENLALSAFKLPKILVPATQYLLDIYKNYVLPVAIYIDLSKEKPGINTEDLRLLSKDPLCVTWITLRAINSLLKTDIPKPVYKIDVPVMIISSDTDTIFPKEYVENIYSRLRCPKKLLIIKGAGHLLMTNYVNDTVGPVTEWLKKYKNPVKNR